jgi:hypothetical protein
MSDSELAANRAQPSPAAADASAPLVLTGRGGSGTRLFSIVLQKLGVFLGNKLNHTEDSVEWVDPVYRIAIDKLRGAAPPVGGSRELLRANAAAILARRCPGSHARWGWKLPETVLILPEVADAFDRCRIIHVVRHPLDTCLRRSHMTSRPNNPIGEAVLRAAYEKLGWTRNPAKDPEHLRNAASWFYQVTEAQSFFRGFSAQRGLTLRYEALCDTPEVTCRQIAEFAGGGAGGASVALEVDEARRRVWERGDSRIDEVWDVCGEAARLHGYRIDDPAPRA